MAQVLRHIVFDNCEPAYPDVPLPAGATLSVGRASGNAIMFIRSDDLWVSKEHAVVRTDAAGRVSVTDLGSTNGTFINNARISPHKPTDLAFGDVVAFGNADAVRGSSSLSFSVSASEVHLRAPPVANAAERLAVVKDDLTCAMCLDLFLCPVALACGHVACEDCLFQWRRRAGALCCAECRAVSRPAELNACRSLRSLLERLVEPLLSDDENAARRRRSEVMDFVRKHAVFKRNATELSKKRKRGEDERSAVV